MGHIAVRLLCLLSLCGVAAAEEASGDVARQPPPDPSRGETYDGRPPPGPGLDVALAVPRLVLLPARVLVVVSEPGAQAMTEFEQRHHIYQHVYDAITWREGQAGIRPIVRWSQNFHPTFGLSYFDERLLGPGTDFDAIAAGGPGNAHAEITGRPTPVSSPIQFRFGSMFDYRDDWVFAGLNNTVPVPAGGLGLSRYRQDALDFDGLIGFRLAPPLVLSVGGQFGWRRFGNGVEESGYPPITDVYCVRLANGACVPGTVNDALVPGFNNGTQFLRASASLHLDTRNSVARASSGLLLDFGADYSHGLGSDESSYFRLHYGAEVPIRLWNRSHVLILSARGDLLAPVGNAPVPFSEFPTLGGPNSLRGFLIDEFRGESTFLATAEYRFPIWMWMDMNMFVDYGGVFGQWYDNFGASQMQPDVGLGLRIRTRERFYLRTAVAYGFGGGWQVFVSTVNWP